MFIDTLFNIVTTTTYNNTLILMIHYKISTLSLVVEYKTFMMYFILHNYHLRSNTISINLLG